MTNCSTTSAGRAPRRKTEQTYNFPNPGAGFLLTEDDVVNGTAKLMEPRDVDFLVKQMKGALWFCDVILESGVRTEIFATLFKDTSHIQMVMRVFKEIRNCIHTFLNGKAYMNRIIRIVKSIPHCGPGVEFAIVCAPASSETAVCEELRLSEDFFKQEMQLEDLHLMKVEAEFSFFHGLRHLNATTIIHEMAHMVSTFHKDTFLRVADDPAADKFVRRLYDQDQSPFAIKDIDLKQVARCDSAMDQAILKLAESELRPDDPRTKLGGAWTAYGTFATYLTAFTDGHIASLFNADNYALLAVIHGALYIETILKSSDDPNFLTAAAELSSLVERFGLEYHTFCLLKLPTAESRIHYVFDQLTLPSRHIYESKKAQIIDIVKKVPKPLARLDPTTRCYSLAGYTDCARVPINLSRYFPAPIDAICAADRPDIYPTARTLHLETLFARGGSLAVPESLFKGLNKKQWKWLGIYLTWTGVLPCINLPPFVAEVADCKKDEAGPCWWNGVFDRLLQFGARAVPPA